MFARKELRAAALFAAALFLLAVLLPGCGKPAQPGSAQVTPSNTPSSTSSSSPTPSPSPHQTYSDSTYRFSVDYPMNYVVRNSDPAKLRTKKAGWLASAGFYEKAVIDSGETPRGITLRVYERASSSSLREWVNDHSAPSSQAPGKSVYFTDVKSIADATVGGQSALSFEWWDGQSGAGSVRAVAFFHQSVALVIELWTADAPNAPRATFDEIVASWRSI